MLLESSAAGAAVAATAVKADATSTKAAMLRMRTAEAGAMRAQGDQMNANAARKQRRLSGHLGNSGHGRYHKHESSHAAGEDC